MQEPSFVIEPADLPGNPWQVLSKHTGHTLYYSYLHGAMLSAEKATPNDVTWHLNPDTGNYEGFEIPSKANTKAAR